MKPFLIGLFVVALSLSSSISSAQEVVRLVVSLGTDKAIPVDLYPGTGVTINFAKVGAIETIFLDNPNLVAVDSDGCLVGIQQSCAKNQASLLHLKLLSGSNAPGIPRSSRSGLTVVIASEKGERRLVLFDLKKGRRSWGNRTAIIDVVPSDRGTDLVSRVSAGVEVANKRGLLTPSLLQKCELLIQYLKAGNDIPTAAKLAGVTEVFVNKLIALGTS